MGKWAKEVSTFPGQCIVQFQTRPQSFHMSHASGKNMFMHSPTYVNAKSTASGDMDKLFEVLKDDSTRKAIMMEMAQFRSKGAGMMFEQYVNDKGVIIPSWFVKGDLVYPWTATYEPTEDELIPKMAERTGKTVLDVCYDLLLDTGGSHGGVLWRPLFGYSGNNDNIVQSLEYDNVIPGFDDAGAHCTILTDATSNTSNVSYYGRDRTVGGRLPLEKIVKVQTKDAAALFGLHDRGVIQAGKRADINVMDFEKLNIKSPYWANDLPTNAGRWLQYTEGYHTTVLRGVVTFRNDEHTGQLPGRLVRNPLANGLTSSNTAVQAADVASTSDGATDLTQYAVELSRDGGASAVARVLRDDKGGAQQSKL